MLQEVPYQTELEMDLWEKKKSGNVFENFFIFKFHLKPYPKGARVEGVQGSEIQKKNRDSEGF